MTSNSKQPRAIAADAIISATASVNAVIETADGTRRKLSANQALAAAQTSAHIAIAAALVALTDAVVDATSAR